MVFGPVQATSIDTGWQSYESSQRSCDEWPSRSTGSPFRYARSLSIKVLSCAVEPLPFPMCARLESPRPMPHRARPPVSAESEASELASTAGSLVIGLVTPVPSRSVVVRAPARLSCPMGSGDRFCVSGLESQLFYFLSQRRGIARTGFNHNTEFRHGEINPPKTRCINPHLYTFPQPRQWSGCS